ncbi:MAG: flagellar type III secretion system pore protein FliP [Alphaproteobacteria bacterium]|nr:flagellar type III secretion system pore protein FliP [Alphaproteobacteria bacterium]
MRFLPVIHQLSSFRPRVAARGRNDGFFCWLALAALLVLFLPAQAFAQSLSFDLGSGPSTTAHIVQMVLLITVISLAPSILVMVTSFTRIIVVLSFLRTAMGTQTTPPNIVLISLAMFLTLFIMQPTFDAAWENGVQPLMNNQIDEATSFQRTLEPFQEFMLKHTRPKDLDLFVEIGKANDESAAAAKAPTANAPVATMPKKQDAAKGDAKDSVSLRALIPAFMISELRRAFEIGFLLFLPFLIIDMVVASILMSMGMMMLPPSIISLPFKIIFFVLVDGWYLISGSLIKSYGGG